MLETVAFILLGLWLIAIVAGVGGNLIYVLLVIAALLFLVRLIGGPRRSHY